MYPGPEGSSLNHKWAYCNNGVRQVSKVDEVPRGVSLAVSSLQARHSTLKPSTCPCKTHMSATACPVLTPLPPPLWPSSDFSLLASTRSTTTSLDSVSFPTTSLTQGRQAVTFSAPRTTEESGCALRTSRALPEVPKWFHSFSCCLHVLPSSRLFLRTMIFKLFQVRVSVPSSVLPSCPAVLEPRAQKVRLLCSYLISSIHTHVASLVPTRIE